jgi:hypothetical protein
MVDQREIRGHVRTEQNRKSLKFQQLLAACTVVLGVVLLIMSSQAEVAEGGTNTLAVNGFLTLAGGIAWNLVVKALMWWHHG